MGGHSASVETFAESGLTQQHEEILSDLEENAGTIVNLADIMHTRIEELLKDLDQSKKSVAGLTESLKKKDEQLRLLEANEIKTKNVLTQQDTQLRKYKAAYERVQTVNERISKTLTARESYFKTSVQAGKWNNSSLV